MKLNSFSRNTLSVNQPHSKTRDIAVIYTIYIYIYIKYYFIYIYIAKILQFKGLGIPLMEIFTCSEGEQAQKTVVALCPTNGHPCLKDCIRHYAIKGTENIFN